MMLNFITMCSFKGDYQTIYTLTVNLIFLLKKYFCCIYDTKFHSPPTEISVPNSIKPSL